ncbi:MAG: substrate-binding domain-containing protein [Lentisphaerae bacterium]|nr:substrate-binding domain-containing protein [Lentisphaerota bacterium]
MEIELKVQTADPLHVQIQCRLEALIRSGELAPGERIPPTITLVKKWGVHSVAIQKAMSSLAAAGLIERKSRRGTFVRSSADKAVVGVLVSFDLLDERAHFYRALVRATQEEIGRHEWRSLTYDRLGLPASKARAEVVEHLRHDLRHHRFNGLVLLGYPPAYLKQDKFRIDLPLTRFLPMGAPAHEVTVELDYYDFTHSAFAYLAERGRKQIAYFRPFAQGKFTVTRDLDGFADAAAAQGRQIAPESIYRTDDPPPVGAGSLEQVSRAQMLQWIKRWPRGRRRPDSVIVADDIQMRGVAQALHERGLKVPDELEVVCAANEGIEHFYHVPVTRYEFSPREVARQLLSVLWKRMTGETVGGLPLRIRGKIKRKEN